ncbi:hypothetical protein B0H14DRAFT_2722169 [Mycena olivaceomarginata]|nr:hypothetical protein B0H14DRAFT_2722169 [Mycena olivaceomarginata]
MAQSRDSNSIRASVYDVFLELGAFDADSRVAEWIFTDPAFVLPDPEEVPLRLPRQPVKLGGAQRGGNEPIQPNREPAEAKRPPSFAKSFGMNFSPKRIGSRSSRVKSTTSSTSSPSGDGYETDEGYQSASGTPTRRKSRVRAAFSLTSGRSTPTPTSPEPSTKALPSLPPIRERHTLTRTVSSVFRGKRSKSPTPEKEVEDDLQQWHEVSVLSPRMYNPSADNGVALVPPPPSSFRQVPPGPSSFRQVLRSMSASAESVDDTEDNPTSIALPRTLFRSISLAKRRARPQSLALAANPPSPRLATSLPSSPFILVTEGTHTPGPGGQPQTPFVFVSTIDNPTPGPRARRFSEVTSMTAPFNVYPLSIRRSVIGLGDSFEPAFPRYSRSCTSLLDLEDALAASAASPYDIYNQPIPSIQRGKEAPFPVRPVLPQPLSMSTGAAESRLATIQRYREFSAQLVELTPYKKFVEM